MSTFTIDARAAGKLFPHYWERCVGSGHASLALRRDWQDQLKQCHDELGFKFVRFHGILDDDMSVFTGREDDPYSFHNVGLIFDYLLSIGMKPFIELSFMPERLASGTDTVFHYKGNITPPKDYEAWGNLVAALAAYLQDRYGADEVERWFFEVWNEPNLVYFWSGTQAEYFQLYAHAAKAIKRVNPRFRVGGPSTAANAWVSETLAFCEKEGVPLDFISTHHYPTDVALGHFQNMEESMAAVPRGILRDMCATARQQAKHLPLFYTEWNNSPSCRDSFHDDPYAAAFVIKTLADNDGLVDMYSYWTFSDIFEETYFSSKPFHGGFGLLNIHGLKKPTYHAFRLLRRMGETRLPICGEAGGTVECLATRTSSGVGVLLYNHNIPKSPIAEEAVTICLKGVPATARVTLSRIDAQHGNPKAVWMRDGGKQYPTQDELQRFDEDSAPIDECAAMEACEDGACIDVMVPPHGVVGLFIEGLLDD